MEVNSIDTMLGVGRLAQPPFGALQNQRQWEACKQSILEDFEREEGVRAEAVVWLLPHSACVGVSQDVHVTRLFEVPKQKQPVDPLAREVAVGEFYRIQGRNVALEGGGLAASADGTLHVSVLYALEHCLRWHANGAPWFPSGFNPQEDMFFGHTCFGDMAGKHLPEAAVDQMAKSVAAKFREVADEGEDHTPFIAALFGGAVPTMPHGGGCASAAKEAFYAAPIHLSVLKRLVAWGIYVPFDFVLLRPHIVHKVSTAVAFVAGSTGNIEVDRNELKLDFATHADAFVGEYLVDFKPTIWKPNLVRVVENVLIGDYVSGKDTTTHTHATLLEPLSRSMYVAMVPANALLPNPLHINDVSEFYKAVIDYPVYVPDGTYKWGRVPSTGVCFQGVQYASDAVTGWLSKKVSGTGHLAPGAAPPHPRAVC